MKKINLLVIKAFIGPFIMTFFIALFILLMQFVWKFIDELVGKGLDTLVVIELFSYASASLVPLALPLAVLLSAIMTFGNLAEHYELVACKAAGISLQRIMLPLVMVSLIITSGAFLFSNYVLPKSNLKLGSMLYDIRQQKPAISIKEGIFFNGISGYSIKVNKKDPDGEGIRGVMIYDHSMGMGNTKLVVAERGRMVMSEDQSLLLVTLFNGHTYEEASNKSYALEDSRPFVRTDFVRQDLSFDLGAFKLTRTNEDLFKTNFQMLNAGQLSDTQDSLSNEMTNFYREIKFGIEGYLGVMRYKKPVKRFIVDSTYNPYIPFEKQFSKGYQARVLETAYNQASNIKSFIASNMESEALRLEEIRRCRVEWHLKLTLSLACVILFFIGAPLGAIIKKGGLGMPVVVATLFFILFHILSITGRKFAQEGVMPVTQGMWIATFFLLPLGIFLTYKATSDSNLFEVEAYKKVFRKLFKSSK